MTRPEFLAAASSAFLGCGRGQKSRFIPRERIRTAVGRMRKRFWAAGSLIQSSCSFDCLSVD